MVRMQRCFVCFWYAEVTAAAAAAAAAAWRRPQALGPPSAYFGVDFVFF